MKHAFYENKTKPFYGFPTDALTPAPHFHDAIEVVYVLEGGGTAHADSSVSPIHPGDLFIAFPNQVHYYEGAGKGLYLVLIVRPEAVFGARETMTEYIPKTNVLTLGEGDPALVAMKHSAKREGEGWARTEHAGYVNLLFGSVMPRLPLKQRLRSDNATLKEILEYCTAHYAEDVTLDTLAEALRLSRYHISHVFSDKLGLSFHTYLSTLRINRACELLEEGDKHVTEIAIEVGFGSIRSFNRAFQCLMGMTPLAYRASVGAKKKRT